MAKADLLNIISVAGEDMVVTSPEGVEVTVKGIQNDISTAIDAETGEEVSVRMMEVSLVTASLATIPKVQRKRHTKPWTVTVTGKKWRVADVFDDGTLGRIRVKLEAYDELN